MPEEILLTPPEEPVKKPKKRAPRKKKAEKSPFKLSDNFDLKPSLPKNEIKMKESVKKAQSKTSYGKLAASFVVLTALLLAAVLYFGFSSATITIIPTQEKVSDSLNLQIVNAANVNALGADEVAGVVRQVPVELSQTFAASGKENLGAEVTGQVTIVNNYVKNQPLVASTRLLSSDNKLFRLKNTVNVPAGGQVAVEVYADQPSQAMAVGPGRFTIPGLWAGLQDKIYGQSRAAMKYAEKNKYTIRQSDVDNAVKQLKSQLLANAKTEVGRAYQEYAQTLFAVDDNSVSQELSAKVGEEKENFNLKMKTMVTVVAFNDEEILNQARAKLAAALADDKSIVEFGKADLSYSLASVNLSQGTASVKADYTAKTALKDGAGVISKNNLTGLNLEQLKAYLNGLPEVSGYQIKFFPAFIKKVPSLVDRIKIEIKK